MKDHEEPWCASPHPEVPEILCDKEPHPSGGDHEADNAGEGGATLVWPRAALAKAEGTAP